MRPRVLLGAMVGAYALLCAGLFFAQRSLLFPAPTERAGLPRGFEEVQVPGGTFFIWSRAEVDERLQKIMKSIHQACLRHGCRADGSISYVDGANIAGFVRVADAMLAQGIV